MPFNPWEALGFAVRAAHIVGPTPAAPVRLAEDLEQESGERGKTTLRCISTRGQDGRKTYVISRSGDGAEAAVFWLPWGQNPTVATSVLDKSGADFFLTSGFSGCYFIGCDGAVMHTAAGYRISSGVHPARSALAELVELGEDLNFDADKAFVLGPAKDKGPVTATYGDGTAPFRAVVLGWRSLAKDQWFYAYQDLTLGTGEYAVWKPLRV